MKICLALLGNFQTKEIAVLSFRYTTHTFYCFVWGKTKTGSSSSVSRYFILLPKAWYSRSKRLLLYITIITNLDGQSTPSGASGNEHSLGGETEVYTHDKRHQCLLYQTYYKGSRERAPYTHVSVTPDAENLNLKVNLNLHPYRKQNLYLFVTCNKFVHL